MGKLYEKAPQEVALSRAPLVKVLCQVRFPLQLSIRNDDAVAQFQSELRSEYPFLNKEVVHSFRVEGASVQGAPENAILWRFDDQKPEFVWRVTLTTEFVTLETNRYSSREDFVSRLAAVIRAVDKSFSPGVALRVGVRYVNHIHGEDVLGIEHHINASVLGILSPDADDSGPLRDAAVHSVSEAMFNAEEGRLQARWGKLPARTTHDPAVLKPVDGESWIFDFDMFTQENLQFEEKKITEICEIFSERVYYVFRLMVEESFLVKFGGRDAVASE